jgi:spore germination protein YaaH
VKSLPVVLGEIILLIQVVPSLNVRWTLFTGEIAMGKVLFSCRLVLFISLMLISIASFSSSSQPVPVNPTVTNSRSTMLVASTPTPPMAITPTNIPTPTHLLRQRGMASPRMAITPTNIPTLTRLAQWRSHAQAWIYPGSPACNAPNEYKDGRNIDTLKPQYFKLDATGVLIELTTAADGCNAYSPANAAEIKQYSKHQYVTIAGNRASMNALITDQTKMTNAITTIKNFLQTVGFTGAEIDFEGFARWTPQQYSGYKNFLTQLGDTLHQSGYKLMIDGPAVVADSTSSYQWHYEDFNALPVDYVVVMEYDWQYDFGAGTPVAPLARERDVTQRIIEKITDINKIVIGIPAYGYHGQTGGYTITIDTNAQSQTYPGYNTATRDGASAEMLFATGGVSYDYADSQTLNTKRSLIESLGIKNVSVWHLGGNQWFSGKSEPLT